MSEEKGFEFDKVIQRFEQSKRELSIKLANQAQNYFAHSWDNQGFDGKPWATPLRRIDGTPEYKYPKSGLQRTRATLVRSGALRRSVQNCIRSSSFPIQLVVAIPYAKYHNEGTDKLPKRQFIGQTQELTNMQKKMFIEHINKIFKNV